MRARSWDSHKETLEAILKLFNPQSVFEWGPGASTVVMANYPSVKVLYTVEHNKSWFENFINVNTVKIRDPLKVHIVYQPDLDLYMHVNGLLTKYDLIFVDGRRRVECLKEAKKRLKDESIVILHDAERLRYREGIELFDHKIFTDEGSTVILTDSYKARDKIENDLRSRNGQMRHALVS